MSYHDMSRARWGDEYTGSERQPLVESACFIAVSLARRAILVPNEYAPLLVKSGKFIVDSCQHNIGKKKRPSADLRGTTEINGKPFMTAIIIQFPSIFERSIARLRGREARAIEHITIY